MRDVLALMLAFALHFLGHALLALAQERHWSRVFHKQAMPGSGGLRIRRLLGAVAIASGFACAWWRDGAAFGSVLGLLLTSMAAFAAALTLSWRPSSLSLLGGGPKRPSGAMPSSSSSLTESQ